MLIKVRGWVPPIVGALLLIFIFCNSNLPKEQESITPNSNDCGRIEIAFVCAGNKSTYDLFILLKSIMFNSKDLEMNLHFIVDQHSRLVITDILSSWHLQHIEYSFYSLDRFTHLVDWIPNNHYSGIYSLLKLTLPNILKIKKVLVIDLDVLVLGNINELWCHFQNFSQKQALGFVENQSDWYLGTLRLNYKPWKALNRGINSGVILMHLAKLRKFNWQFVWTHLTKYELSKIPLVSLADQDIFNTVLYKHPWLLYAIPCAWNIQFGSNFDPRYCFAQNKHNLKLIHLNSYVKFKFPPIIHERYPEVGYIIELLHNFYLSLDPYLFRSTIYNSIDFQKSSISTTVRFPLNCSVIVNNFKYQKILFSYFIGDSRNIPLFHSLTLCVHFSFNRWQAFFKIVKIFLGPIHASLWATPSEAETFSSFWNLMDFTRRRNNVVVHLMFKWGQVYPTNQMRNLAMTYVSTLYMYMSDVDFVPSSNLHQINVSSYLRMSKNSALIVPAFEISSIRVRPPSSKKYLLELLDKNNIRPFLSNVWPSGHNKTNFSRWYTANTIYQVEWSSNFEPYVILKRPFVKYDERFSGFGWNKVSHIMELHMLKINFWVLPDVFSIHLPHVSSDDITFYRKNKVYYSCSAMLKEVFTAQLCDKYGCNLTHILKG